MVRPAGDRALPRGFSKRPESGKAVNIYDIAKLAGVSASTVSRVINDKPGIKAETRKLVKRLLKKYNYSPNENARGLVNRVSRTVGILIPDIRDLNHVGSAFLIQRELTASGYCCIIFNTGEGEEERASYMQTLRQRQVDGVILIGSSYQCRPVEEKIAEFLPEIPVVMANGLLELPNVHSVLLDEKNGVANLVELLWNKGRRHFAFIKAEHDSHGNRRKLEGFVQGMANRVDQEDLWLYACENSPQGGYEAAKRIVTEHPEVDVLMFSWDLEAAGAARALLDMRLSVPDQVAITGVDNSVYCEICYPKLSSVDVRQRDMCLTAAKTMLSLLAGETAVRTVVIPPSVVEREST